MPTPIGSRLTISAGNPNRITASPPQVKLDGVIAIGNATSVRRKVRHQLAWQGATGPLVKPTAIPRDSSGTVAAAPSPAVRKYFCMPSGVAVDPPADTDGASLVEITRVSPTRSGGETSTAHNPIDSRGVARRPRATQPSHQLGQLEQSRGMERRPARSHRVRLTCTRTHRTATAASRSLPAQD